MGVEKDDERYYLRNEELLLQNPPAQRADFEPTNSPD
jgi:hypothetical protein